MLELRAEHRKRYEQVAKGLGAAAGNGAHTAAPAQAANGSAKPTAGPTGVPSAGEDAALARLRQATDLLAFLGSDKLAKHHGAIKLYYLIGCCYHEAARSARDIVQMLASPPPSLAADDLAARVMGGWTTPPKQAKAFTVPLNALTKMLGDHLEADVPLVTSAGEGFPFSGLTEAGELFWRLVAEFLQKYLHSPGRRAGGPPHA
jgi:hypothetical protein